MANLRETPTWEAGIYQLETSDPVMGGENGIDNRAPRQLANRTLWLKNELARQIGLINQSLTATANTKADKSVQFTAGAGLTGGGDFSASRSIALGTPSKITATSTNAAVSNTHSHEIEKASTSVAGIVQLVDNLTSNANNQALTARQGKVLNDSKLGNTGTQTLSGQLITTSPIKINNPSTWAGIEIVSGDGSWILETNPSGSLDRRLNFKFVKNGETSLFIVFAKIDKNETVAYQSWVQDGFLPKAANAVSASKLATPRTINGVAFDGTANITIYDNTKAAKTTQITAGAGLTGGGDFSASRSIALGTPSKITATSTNTAVSNTHSHEIEKASTSVAGIVQLNDSLTSSASNLALTAKQGKLLSEQITSLDVRKFDNRGQLGATDLNSLTATSHAGIWYQTGNSNATSERHYPVAQAGTLFVLPAAYQGQQLYFPFAMSIFYKRTTNNNGSWSAWTAIGEIVNDLNSTSTTAALSAAQGKLLKEQIDSKLNKSGDTMTGALQMPLQANALAASTPFAISHRRVQSYSSIYINANTDNNNDETVIITSGKGVSSNKADGLAIGSNYLQWLGVNVATVNSNVASASKLVTPRTINGVAFDGTANITITDNTKVGKSGNETIAGVKTFSSSPKAPTPAAASKDTTVATTAFVHSAIVANDDHNIGMVAFFAMNAAPTGWLKANGAAVSRTTYARLFAKIGTTFGAGDGRNTFNLPDLRGEFVRGVDDGRNIDGGRSLGTAQGDAIRNITGTMIFNEMIGGVPATGVFSESRKHRGNTHRVAGGGYESTITMNASSQVPTASENRPRNIALLACIKY